MSAHPSIGDRIGRLKDAVECIETNRPECPETVSYALDDLRRELEELEATVTGGWYVVVTDTGSNLREFPAAQGVYTDYCQKEWTTYVVTQDGELETIYAGEIVYCAPNNESAETPVPSVQDLKDKHDRRYADGTRWGVER